VDPNAGLNDVGEEKILDPSGTRIPTSSVVQPEASRYSDYYISAPLSLYQIPNFKTTRNRKLANVYVFSI
jgi:hypothetical protein